MYLCYDYVHYPSVCFVVLIILILLVELTKICCLSSEIY